MRASYGEAVDVGTTSVPSSHFYSELNKKEKHTQKLDILCWSAGQLVSSLPLLERIRENQHEGGKYNFVLSFQDFSQ